MKCLVIIPAYNEEENIVRVVENLKNNYPMYDYIVINDGSSDSTAKICRKNGYELVDLPSRRGSNTPIGMATITPSSLTRTDSTARNLSAPCWTRFRRATISSSVPGL